MPSHLLAAALILLPLTAGGATDVKATSRVDAVVVYRSSARVTRLARAELPAGEVRLLVEGLPVGIVDDSVRVEGQGTSKGRIWGVSVEPFTRAAAVDGSAREAEERIEKLLAEDRVLEDQGKVADQRRKFVESLRSTYSDERAKNLAVRGIPAKEWADLVAFVDSQLAGSAAEIRKVELSRRELGRRVVAARAELEKVRAKRAETTKTVAVELTVDRAGPFELAVSYVANAASWGPVWDARLDPATEGMELSLRAEISQQTGEDWTDVRLQVSTAEPGRGLYVPRLESRWLTAVPPPPPPAPYRAKSARGAPAPAAMMEKAMAAPRAAPHEAEETYELAAPQATAEQGLLAATFTTPRRESVDGSGKVRSVALSRFPLKARIARVTAPRVEPSVFLTAKAPNETGLPLLAGMAGVYVGDEFVGRAPLPATPPGGELEMAFGADGRVEVERRVLERKHETAGIVSKDELFRFHVRFTLKNRYAVPVEVRLLDLVPVSRDEKIEVKLLDGTTPPTRDDPERPGVKSWELKLAAKEERVVQLRYEVRYPRGLPIQGLE